MAGDDPYTAVKAFIAPLQAAISCVSNSVISVTGYDPLPDTEPPHLATLNKHSPARIGGNIPHHITVDLYYRIVQAGGKRGHWKVTITDYLYHLLGRDPKEELILYHWHPTQTPDLVYPHMHMGYGLQLGRKALGRTHPQKVHFPTGRVALEEFIRLLIEEMGLPVRRERQNDWDAVLRRTQQAFEKWRTWPAPVLPSDEITPG